MLFDNESTRNHCHCTQYAVNNLILRNHHASENNNAAVNIFVHIFLNPPRYSSRCHHSSHTVLSQTLYGLCVVQSSKGRRMGSILPIYFIVKHTCILLYYPRPQYYKH